MEKSSSTTLPSFYHFISASLATCMAVTFTNPMDLIKIRMQLQGELCASRSYVHVYRSLPHAFFTISSHEGPLALQKGLTAAYGYQTMLNGTRFMVYEHMKNLLCNGQSKAGTALGSVAAGALAGISGAFVSSPFNLVKTRMQSYSTYIAVGEQHHYTSFIHGLKEIYRHSGISGLFQGVSSSMLRTGAGSSVQLTTYDACKNYIAGKLSLPNSSILVHLFSAFASGFAVCIVTNPFDVMMTRIYNQGSSRKYSGILDCLFKSLKTEGFLALYKGFWPHYLRMGPHTILTFVFIEQVKKVISVVL